MGIFKIVSGEYKGEESIRKLIRYILDPEKNPHGIYHATGISQEDIEKTVKRFIKVQKRWGKEKGKRILHFVISFSDDEQFTYKQYKHIGYLFAKQFKDDYQLIFAFHECDKNGEQTNYHIHYGINPISYNNGKRMKLKRKDIYIIREYLNTIIKECQNG